MEQQLLGRIIANQTKNVAGIQNLTALIHYPGIDTPVEVPVKVWVYKFDFANSVYKIQIGQTFLEVLGLKNMYI